MRKLLPILVIAAAANVIMAGSLYYLTHVGTRYDEYISYIFYDLWISSFVVATVISIVRRKYLYKGVMILWTLLALIACTPLPFGLIMQAFHQEPEVMLMETKYDYPPDKVTSTEHWQYGGFDSKTFVDKRFIADSAEWNQKPIGKPSTADSLDLLQKNDAAFKKDGRWVFFARSGDTVLVEDWQRGRLLKMRRLKK